MADRSATDAMEVRRLRRHFLEMCIAMVAGMVVLGGVVRLVCAASGHEELLENTGTSAPVMATNMAIGMAAWMRHRGNGWPATIEMVTAMYVPLVVLAVPYALGLLAGGAFAGGAHVLMLPAMWIAIWRRRDEHAGGHLEAPSVQVS